MNYGISRKYWQRLQGEKRVNDFEDQGDKWLQVPCPSCFAHTGEKCKPDNGNIERTQVDFAKGFVHSQREYEARNAMQRTANGSP